MNQVNPVHARSTCLFKNCCPPFQFQISQLISSHQVLRLTVRMHLSSPRFGSESLLLPWFAYSNGIWKRKVMSLLFMSIPSISSHFLSLSPATLHPSNHKLHLSCSPMALRREILNLKRQKLKLQFMANNNNIEKCRPLGHDAI
jgi:hypothetical protein